MKKSTKVLIGVEIIIILGLAIGIFVSKSNTNNIANDTNKNISTNTNVTQSDYNVEDTVYVTDTGTKYHKSGCQHLRKSKNAISKEKAIRQGYTACSRCNP